MADTPIPYDVFGQPRSALEQEIYNVAVKAIDERLRPPPYFVTGTTMDDERLLVSRALLQLQIQRLERRIAQLEEARKPWWKRWWSR